MKKRIFIFAIVISILNLFDSAATSYGLTHQFIEESNPLMLAVWDVSPLLFAVVKLLLSLLIVGVSIFIYKTSKVTFQRLFLAMQSVVLAIYLYIFSLHLYWLTIL